MEYWQILLRVLPGNVFWYIRIRSQKAVNDVDSTFGVCVLKYF